VKNCEEETPFKSMRTGGTDDGFEAVGSEEGAEVAGLVEKGVDHLI
jgi:hypothetical protein